MKIGVVGFGNRIAHVFHELKKINGEVDLVAYVDPQPIGKEYAINNNFFPKNDTEIKPTSIINIIDINISRPGISYGK